LGGDPHTSREDEGVTELYLHNNRYATFSIIIIIIIIILL